MKAYSIFDDFPQSSIDILTNNGIEVTLLPKGKERPSGDALKKLLDEYDILFISTAQKMPEEMFSDIITPKIIGTASSGTDHIHIPENKKDLVKIANATHANRTTVTEHTFGLLLTLRKQLLEGRRVAAEGKNKKAMVNKPVDLFGSTMGVVGAGGIASTIIKVASFFGMKTRCWTLHPEKHTELKAENVEFTNLETIFSESDNIVINIPLSEKTKGLITHSLISKMKRNASIVVTSRLEVIDIGALFAIAKDNPSLGLAVDADAVSLKDLWSTNQNNVIVTPHIAGGTIESRIRLFNECTLNAVNLAI